MPTLPNGIEYQVCPWFNGGQGYTEVFVRDGSQISCVLSCKWEDAADFKAGVRGYSLVDEFGYLRRSLPLLCPYTTRKYAERLELVAYGNDRLNATKLAEWTDTIAEDEMIYPGTDLDAESEDWFKAGIAFYRVTFTKPPFLSVLSDEELEGYGEEYRYTRWVDTTRIRELKRPDYGFETDEATGVKPTPIPIVGFSPYVEREIRCTWYQIPWGYVPHNAIRANALCVNSAEFYGHNPGTLRFDSVTGIENPYEDADGGLYVDVEYIFKKLEVFDPADPTGTIFSYGWNDFRTSAYDVSGNPVYKPLRQRGWTSGVKVPPYKPVATFPDLFKVEDHTS